MHTTGGESNPWPDQRPASCRQEMNRRLDGAYTGRGGSSCASLLLGDIQIASLQASLPNTQWGLYKTRDHIVELFSYSGLTICRLLQDQNAPVGSQNWPTQCIINLIPQSSGLRSSLLPLPLTHLCRITRLDRSDGPPGAARIASDEIQAILSFAQFRVGRSARLACHIFA